MIYCTGQKSGGALAPLAPTYLHPCVGSCISEVLLVTIVPEVPMVSLVSVAVSIRYMLW